MTATYYQHVADLPTLKMANGGRLANLSLEGQAWLDARVMTSSSNESTVRPSLWSALTPPSPQSIWPTTEIITLSPSSINRYMACPRQFFYQHVLRLPTPASETLLQGLLVHGLMETLNRQFPEYPYSAQRLHDIFKLFMANNESLLKDPNSGLTYELYEQWNTLPTLLQEQLSQVIPNTIDDLEASGYFNQTPTAILSEQKIHYTHPSLPNVAITGALDALIGYESNDLTDNNDLRWKIVDYKTGQTSRYRQSDDKEQASLLKALEPLPINTEDALPLTHTERFKDRTSRNYQIPLYYLATQVDTKLQQALHNPPPTVDSIGLQVLRPSLGDGIGSRSISVSGTSVEARLDSCLSDLRQWIVEPLQQSDALPTVTGLHCQQCAFTAICNDPNIGKEAPRGPYAKNKTSGEGESP
ncbi:MAG: PD-(D/E)XK nuclease family protein [Vampirovibrionales bacterium]|nr:PD-(D/E)XK nuclease family protein [Vampirovibrionales bacterium]